MRVVVVGAGPAGSVAALLLSRQGHDVTVVDRNTGPSGAEPWERKGVFQFHLPHAYRAPTVAHLEHSLPDVYAALLAAGGRPVQLPGAPEVVVGLGCRRETFDAVLWAAVRNESGLTLRNGHVDSVEVTGATVTGVRLNGVHLPADLVVDASGRGMVSAPLRGVPEGGPCGFAYIARTYRLHPGAEPGPINAPPGHTTFRNGYGQIVFRHDNGYFDVLIIRAAGDKELAELRHEALWDRAIRLLPGAGAWTHPDRARPAGPIRAGSGLTNTYLGQALDLIGLLTIGDAIATTNPIGGRGVSPGDLVRRPAGACGHRVAPVAVGRRAGRLVRRASPAVGERPDRDRRGHAPPLGGRTDRSAGSAPRRPVDRCPAHPARPPPGRAGVSPAADHLPASGPLARAGQADHRRGLATDRGRGSVPI